MTALELPPLPDWFGNSLNVFITMIEKTMSDSMRFFADIGPIIIPAIVLVTFLVLISGTILTVMYIVLAALKPRW